MVFEKKKIQIETLGEYLTEVRDSLGLPLKTVSEKTNIKLKFLQALEDGKYASLPADVYVLGFLKQLAQLYVVDASELIAQYKKEKNIVQQIEKKSLLKQVNAAQYLRKIIITPKYISILLGLLFVVVTVGYIIWQVFSINRIPTLEIMQPQDRQVIKDSSVQVVGKTDPNMNVVINGESVFVDNKGNFTTQLSMSNGPEQLNFTASNKFNKTITKIISITGDISTPAVLDASTGTPVSLKLDFINPVTIEVVQDRFPRQVMTFQTGDSKLFTANNKILITTSDAGATKVTFNGQSLGVMGRPKEKLIDIPFFVESGTMK